MTTIGVLLGTPCVVSAQDTTTTKKAPRDSSGAQSIGAMVTSATRYESTVGSQPRKIEIISREVIERTAALELADVLKRRSGIDVIQYPGQLANIGIRGFRPSIEGATSRNLVLIDGRPAGTINLALFDMARVERIDVIKGPASALYGSTAMGGVVNLVTRRRTGGFGGTVRAQGGSFGSTDLSVLAGGQLGAGFDADIGVRRLDQREDMRLGDGNLFRSALGANQALKKYPTGVKPDRIVGDSIGDGVLRPYSTQNGTNAQLRIGRAITSNWRAEFAAEGYKSDGVPAPGDIIRRTPSRKNVQRGSASLEARGTVGRFLPLARVYWNDEGSEYFNRPDTGRFVSSTAALRTEGIQLQSAAPFGAHRVVVGADLSRVQSSGLRFSNATTRIAPFSPIAQNRSMALFGEGELHWMNDRLVTTIGGRIDQVTLSLRETPLRPDVRPGSDNFLTFNPSAGIRYRLNQRVSVHASGGRAFLAPDPSARAGLIATVAAPGQVNMVIGNPTLPPEASVSLDAGFSVSSGNGAFDGDFSVFHSKVSDRTVTARASFSGTSRPRLSDGSLVNRVDTRVGAGNAEIAGLELSMRYDVLRALNRPASLAWFVNGTHFLTYRERALNVVVDGARFANQTNFNPASVFDAVSLGSGTYFAIKNIAPTSVTSGIEFDDLKRFTVSLSGRYVGRRLDSDFSDALDPSDILYPKSLTADLTAGVRLPRGVRLTGMIMNLTDENYYEKRGFNLPGRSFTLRMSTGF
jgi:vitamin B12 transporter